MASPTDEGVVSSLASPASADDAAAVAAPGEEADPLPELPDLTVDVWWAILKQVTCGR